MSAELEKLIERVAAALEDIAENGRCTNELSAAHLEQNRKQNALTKAWFRYNAEREGRELVEVGPDEYWRFVPGHPEVVAQRARQTARTQKAYEAEYYEEVLVIDREAREKRAQALKDRGPKEQS